MDDYIKISGAREHNLKNISIDIPKNKLVVITGLSGSGKSSLAFDTIYAEGQRRYVESLSSYARQFLQLQDKPEVDSITGLSPAIAIDQKTVSRNPRSTVGTTTEIYDYMRLLWSSIGIPHSPTTGKPIVSQTLSEIVAKVSNLPKETKIHILAPFVKGRKGEYIAKIISFKKQGFTRIRINGEIYDINSIPQLNSNKLNNMEIVVDRLVINDDIGNRLSSSIETALQISDGLLYVDIIEVPEESKSDLTEKFLVFSEKFCCPESGFTITEIEPRLFSFNSPFGACKVCNGLGTEKYFNPDLIIQNRSLSLEEGAIEPWSNLPLHQTTKIIRSLSKHYNFSGSTPFKDLSEKIQNIILYGSGDEEIEFEYDKGSRNYIKKELFIGVIKKLENKLAESEKYGWTQDELVKYQGTKDCSSCNGHRLNKEALSIKISGKNIGEVAGMTTSDSLEWFNNLADHLSEIHKKISERILSEVCKRITFLTNVGLEYLTLSRSSSTLSGGESQRIRLASQIGSGLTGVLYVLDEPSIGLHQCDNDKLFKTLEHLKSLGNSVIVVEHDEETMLKADYLIDIGPGAGIHGGNVIVSGTPEEVLQCPESITGQYLSKKKAIPVPKKRRPWNAKNVIEIKGACANNLKNIDVTIPNGLLTCITGVSGGGKSSLIIHTLYKIVAKKLYGSKATPGKYSSITGLESIDKVIEIDQSPIGKTPRSNPATYSGTFGHIRDWFTNLPESKARGYKPGRFSFNVKGGRCETCQGDGMIKIEMHFLPDVYVSCDVCNGSRYNKETLEVLYKGKSIADILDMNIEKALEFFVNIPAIHEKLVTLNEVGLNYIKLGQSATTLSGGESQRVKLAKELSKKSMGRTLYILDEPTTGLHTYDIHKLLKVLHKLADNGNTICVIEHNLDVIKTADYIIDIGPNGGSSGGEVVFAGTPEEIIPEENSITGKYLKPYLQ